MKRTTRNNIVRYAILAAYILTCLIVGLLISIGLDWLSDKTGWPILSSFGIICFVYLVWRVGKGITVSDEEEQVVKLEPSNDLLEKEIKEQIDKYYENCNKKLEEMGEDDNDISFLTLDGFARHFYELGLKAKEDSYGYDKN